MPFGVQVQVLSRAPYFSNVHKKQDCESSMQVLSRAPYFSNVHKKQDRESSMQVLSQSTKGINYGRKD